MIVLVEGADRHQQVFDAVARAPSVDAAVEAVRDGFGLDHATYHHSQIFGQSMDAPYVKSTYTSAWLVRYLLRGYIRIDPVIREGFARQLPFDWRELTLTPASQELMVDAAAHGLRGNGYSIPLIDKQIKRALFSVTSDMPPAEWDAFIEHSAGALAEVAMCIHARAIQEIYGQTDPVPRIFAREIEALSWAAQGKEHKQIAVIMGISSSTARHYLTNARLRLDCTTLAQAVGKAIRLGLIRE